MVISRESEPAKTGISRAKSKKDKRCTSSIFEKVLFITVDFDAMYPKKGCVRNAHIMVMDEASAI